MLIGWFISLLATCQAFHNFTDYLSHDEMYEFLEATHRSYPNMTHIYSIGKSLQGSSKKLKFLTPESSLFCLTPFVY